MKNKKIISLVSLCIAALGLASCSGKGATTTEDPNAVHYTTFKANVSTGTVSGTYNLPDDIQDGCILHAWNWSYNTIKENLKSIAESGYCAVQTSPVQQSKSSAKSGAWTSEWSKLYQPAAFSVAEDSYLGTKDELKALCAEAKKYNIRIICDIVSNHMANDETGAAGSYSERIGDYESEIYGNTTKYFHQYTLSTTDESAKTVTQYELSSLPDLNTSNEYIQTRVTDLLKECIDCGVSGFRFDAAKHIETPDDGEYASNYWPTVLGGATEYAKSKGLTSPFYYGEILNTVGGGRSYDSYTKYMSITDSSYSKKILGSVNNFANSSYADNFKYSFSEDGTKAVVWAESHDNYADKTTSSYAQEKLNRVYAVEMSHSGAAGLYLARPEDNTSMGDMGTKAWKSAEIAAVNAFHNDTLGQNETVSCQNGLYLNEKGDSAAMIVSMNTVSSATAITVEVGSLKDGSYYDQVTGNVFTVADGVASGTIGTSGIAVLETKEAAIAPEVTVTPVTGYYYGTISDEKKGSLTATVTIKNYTEASFTINGENETKFENVKMKVDVACDADTSVLKIDASNSMRSTSEEYTFKKVAYREGYQAMAGLKSADSVKYFAWVWYSGKSGKWIEVEVVGDVAYIPFANLDDYNCYLLASFSSDMTLEKLQGLADPWSVKLGQTADVKITKSYVTVETSTI